ncbi:hypothetical protein SJI19_20750 [Acerihabitans sp. TG2]|uniref:hypothetical protein n=1 Tax=Acerihabitans sp. TG2 TaxID=3096008 RepID=UPI002B23388C|nr:hypothetical protein [Acerihabitans sp. TG2]MEA9392933.1 hypothetical protein [Acerihabitans sp. TG2]
MSNTINPRKLAPITDLIAKHTDDINAEMEKKAVAPTTPFQRAFSRVGNTTLKPLWRSLQGFASGLKSNLSVLMSTLTLSKQPQKTTGSADTHQLIENIINDPQSEQVSPSTILSQLTNGSCNQRGVIGNDLQRYLGQNPNSALFSSENSKLSLKDGEIILTFKELKDFPQQISSTWPQGEKKSTDEYHLILDSRIKTKGAYGGSCMYQLLTHPEFTFTSLSDLARKMTMCTHLNTALNNQGMSIAHALNLAPENSIVFEGEHQKRLDKFVTFDPVTKQYRARHPFDIAQGVDYWKPAVASTPVNVGAEPLVNFRNLPLIGQKPVHTMSVERLRAKAGEIKAARTLPSMSKQTDAKQLTPFGVNQTYQAVYTPKSREQPVIAPTSLGKPAIAPKPKTMASGG